MLRGIGPRQHRRHGARPPSPLSAHPSPWVSPHPQTGEAPATRASRRREREAGGPPSSQRSVARPPGNRRTPLAKGERPTAGAAGGRCSPWAPAPRAPASDPPPPGAASGARAQEAAGDVPQPVPALDARPSPAVSSAFPVDGAPGGFRPDRTVDALLLGAARDPLRLAAASRQLPGSRRLALLRRTPLIRGHGATLLRLTCLRQAALRPSSRRTRRRTVLSRARGRRVAPVWLRGGPRGAFRRRLLAPLT
jgi:hypothetical protein